MKTKADAIATAKEGCGIAIRLPDGLAKPLRAWEKWLGAAETKNG